MSILEKLPFIGKLFEDAIGVVKEVVPDVDARNVILGKLGEISDGIEKDVYLRELDTKTVPWVDSIHKMGRQLLNLITIFAVVFLVYHDKDVTGPMVLLMGGGNAVYQYIKGKGK